MLRTIVRLDRGLYHGPQLAQLRPQRGDLALHPSHPRPHRSNLRVLSLPLRGGGTQIVRPRVRIEGARDIRGGDSPGVQRADVSAPFDLQ